MARLHTSFNGCCAAGSRIRLGGCRQLKDLKHRKRSPPAARITGRNDLIPQYLPTCSLVLLTESLQQVEAAVNHAVQPLVSPHAR